MYSSETLAFVLGDITCPICESIEICTYMTEKEDHNKNMDEYICGKCGCHWDIISE
jgi:hypothetical protein